MNTIIGWQGGKNKLRKKIVSMLPYSYRFYGEAFVGGGSVFFEKPKTPLEYINDINKNLTTTWLVIRDKKDELVKSFKYTPISRELFYSYCEKYRKHDYENDIEQAHILIYLVKVGFGSKVKKPSFGSSKQRSSSLNYKTLPHLIDMAWERLQGVSIENKPYQEFVSMYDDKESLFYFDPPYHGTTGYDFDTWEDSDYIKLAKTCKTIQGKFLLTINKTPLIKTLFEDFYIFNHDVQYCLSRTNNDQIVKELIITNYPLEKNAIVYSKQEQKSFIYRNASFI